MFTDVISDYLTRIRNGCKNNIKITKVPMTKMNLKLTNVLVGNGFLDGYEIIKEGFGMISVRLRYYGKSSVIKNISRISKPGLRIYSGYKNMPVILNGLGLIILSTPKGVMTNKEALGRKIGGELLFSVY